MNTTNRERVTVALAGLSAGVGIFMPSSIGGTIEPRLTILSCLILWLLTVMIGFTNGYSVIRSTIALLIIAELFLATLLSPLGEFTPGALPPYLLLVTILSLNIRSPGKISSAAVTVFGGISAVLQIFALSLVFGLDPVNEVNSSLYRAYSDELYEIMVLLYAKPVTVFASHSVAAFMYFAFLVTHAEVFKVAKTRMRRIFNAVSVAIFLYLLIHLTSTTGFVLFAIASVWLAYRIIPYAVCRSPLPALALIVLVGVGVFYSVK